MSCVAPHLQLTSHTSSGSTTHTDTHPLAAHTHNVSLMYTSFWPTTVRVITAVVYPCHRFACQYFLILLSSCFSCPKLCWYKLKCCSSGSTPLAALTAGAWRGKPETTTKAEADTSPTCCSWRWPQQDPSGGRAEHSRQQIFGFGLREGGPGGGALHPCHPPTGAGRRTACPARAVRGRPGCWLHQPGERQVQPAGGGGGEGMQSGA